MGYKLFLDDSRKIIEVIFYIKDPIYTQDGWKVAKNYDEFVSIVTEFGLPDYVSFDHDLADIHYQHKEGEEIDYSKYTEKTGYECAKWLVDYCMDKNLPFPNYRVHSMNGVGRRNIMYYIENYKRYRLRID